MKKNIIINVSQFVIFLLASTLVTADSIYSPDAARSVHCTNEEEYRISKWGGYGPKKITLVPRGDGLHTLIYIGSHKCKKLANGKFKWVKITPYEDIRVDHEYFDTDTNAMKVVKVTRETKRAWVSFIDKDFNPLAVVDIKEREGQYYAYTVIPFSKISSPQQWESINSGKIESLKIGFFLRALSRHVSNGEDPPFEEETGIALTYINFKMVRKNGKLQVIR